MTQVPLKHLCRCGLMLLILSMTAVTVAATPPRLEISRDIFAVDSTLAAGTFSLLVEHGLVGGSECVENVSERQHAFMIGTVGVLVVSVYYPNSIILPYRGVQDWSWPAALTIEACISTAPVASQFRSSTETLTRLDLQYFVHYDAVFTDSLWRFAGVTPPADDGSYSRPKFWFKLAIDPAWNKKYLCVRARYSNPEYGDLVSPVSCFRVSAPCSKADSARIPWSNILAFRHSREYARAFAYADSLLAAGWIEREAMNEIAQTAFDSYRFEDQLRYTDIQFNHYGTVCHECGEEIVPITAGSRARYALTRQGMIRRGEEMRRGAQQRH